MARDRVQTWMDQLLVANGLDLVRVIDAIQGAFGPANVPDLPDLIGMLGHPDARVRFGAAVALGAIGPGAAVAVPDLLPLLRDPDAQVRHDAATALRHIDPKRPEVIKGLFRLLLDDDDDAQAAAEEALDQILQDYDGPGAAKFKRRYRLWRD